MFTSYDIVNLSLEVSGLIKSLQHGERFKTRTDAKFQVFEYIEVYCNRKRLHSNLGYLSALAFEDNANKKVA